MITNKLNILFLISKSRTNKKGLAPLICRITYLGKRKPFSTGLFISPKSWHSKQQQAKPPDANNDFINAQLSLITQKINEAFLFLQVNQETFDVEDIYLQFKGENTKADKTLLEVFGAHNEKMEKLVGKSYTKGTYSKFVEVMQHTANFIKHSYGKNNVLLASLKLTFLDDFDYYMKSEKNHKQVSINKAIQRIRRIVKLAMADGYLQKDPFLMYQPKKYEKEVIYLTHDELKRLEKHQFAQSRLQHVKDMFVFCCYTGLAYAEMASLEPKHLQQGFDGNTWIKLIRKKTQKMVSVPLLPIAENIIGKYRTDDTLLPVISNQKFNSYLKEIAAIVGIEKNLTHHVARKTFATTVLLYNDVPIEIVSELLGHSKITITQDHYGKIVQKKVSEQMEKLKQKLKE